MAILLFILVLLVVVLIHEFGHFSVAKFFGIRVDEFGFGFPPKLFSKKFGEVEYSFNLLPIGGFVRIFGETPDEESLSGPDADRSFVNKPAHVQAAVLFAGVFFNWILAWLLLSAIFMMGVPAFSSDPVPYGGTFTDGELTVFAVSPDTPAYEAGLRGREQVISLSAGDDVLLDEGYANGTEYITDLRSFLANHSDGVDFTYVSPTDDTTKTVHMVPIDGIAEDRVALGVGIDYVGTLKINPVMAFWEGMKRTAILTKMMIVGFYDFFGDMFTGQADFSEISGPVGIVSIVGEASASGFISFLFIIAIISINLAILNLLPFPALDGGRLLFLLIEVIKGSPIQPKIANSLNTLGFILLIVFMLVVTYHDIIKF